jgi:hypothetical protein
VVRVGESIEFAVDHARFHFFDPATGLSLEAGTRAPAAA